MGKIKLPKADKPRCGKCGNRMMPDEGMSTRFSATVFRCTKCNGIAARDASGKPFIPPYSTR